MATLSLARGNSTEPPFTAFWWNLPSHWDVAEVSVKDTVFAHLQQHHLIVQHTWLLLAVGLYAAHKVWVGRIHPLHEHHQGMLARAEEDQQSIKPKHCHMGNILQQGLFSHPAATSWVLATTGPIPPWSVLPGHQENLCLHNVCFNHA